MGYAFACYISTTGDPIGWPSEYPEDWEWPGPPWPPGYSEDSPQIVLFSASPSVVDPGESTTLTWRTKNADRVRLGTSVVSSSGSTTVTVDEETTYRLRAVGEGEPASASITVKVDGSEDISGLEFAYPFTGQSVVNDTEFEVGIRILGQSGSPINHTGTVAISLYDGEGILSFSGASSIAFSDQSTGSLSGLSYALTDGTDSEGIVLKAMTSATIGGESTTLTAYVRLVVAKKYITTTILDLADTEVTEIDHDGSEHSEYFQIKLAAFDSEDQAVTDYASDTPLYVSLIDGVHDKATLYLSDIGYSHEYDVPASAWENGVATVQARFEDTFDEVGTDTVVIRPCSLTYGCTTTELTVQCLDSLTVEAPDTITADSATALTVYVLKGDGSTDQDFWDEGLIRVQVSDSESNVVQCKISEGGTYSDYTDFSISNYTGTKYGFTSSTFYVDCEDQDGEDITVTAWVVGGDTVTGSDVAEASAGVPVVVGLYVNESGYSETWSQTMEDLDEETYVGYGSSRGGLAQTSNGYANYIYRGGLDASVATEPSSLVIHWSVEETLSLGETLDIQIRYSNARPTTGEEFRTTGAVLTTLTIEEGDDGTSDSINGDVAIDGTNQICVWAIAAPDVNDADWPDWSSFGSIVARVTIESLEINGIEYT